MNGGVVLEAETGTTLGTGGTRTSGITATGGEKMDPKEEAVDMRGETTAGIEETTDVREEGGTTMTRVDKAPIIRWPPMQASGCVCLRSLLVHMG